jgi:hypothetical protein
MMRKRTTDTYRATEGAGLGHPPTVWSGAEHDALNATASSMRLDPIAAAFAENRTYSASEAREVIRRKTRTAQTDHAAVDAIFFGLLNTGGLQTVEWKRGVVSVRRGDLSTPRMRREAADRSAYQMCQDARGDWAPVRRDQAAAYNRRVRLEVLDAEERAAEQRSHQRRALRAQVEAETFA